MGKGNGMRVRFASPPRTTKTQEKVPPPPAHDEALDAIRDAAAAARAAPGAPDAVALQGLLRRLGRVAVQVLEAEPEEKTPPRRAAAVATETVALDAADLAAVRRANARAAAAATTLGCREVSYPADLVAFLRDRSAYECRSAAAAAAGKDRRNAQRAVVRALTRHARRPPSPERPRRTRPAKSVARDPPVAPRAPEAAADAAKPIPSASDAAASASTPAADEPVLPLNAMERDVLAVLDDTGEIFMSHLPPSYRRVHGKDLDYRALGFERLKLLVERLPGVSLQPGQHGGIVRRARCEEDLRSPDAGDDAQATLVAAAPAPAVSSNADEKPTAPDTVASPPPPARPHRSVPTPVLMGEIEADLGANLRPERPTPKRILQRDDAPIDESADSAVSGAGRTEALEIGGIYAGICSGLAPFGAFVSLDRGGVGLVHRSNCRLDPAGAPILPAKRDRLFVRVLRIRDDGKLDFSTLGLDPKTGAPTPDAGATTTTAPREVPAAARNAKPAVPSLRAVEREVLEVIDDCGGEILLANFIKSYKRVHGKPLDYRALGFARLALLVERLPGVCLRPGASGEILRRANVSPPTASHKPRRKPDSEPRSAAVTPDASPDAARKPRPSPPTIDSDYERRPAAARAAPPPPAAVPDFVQIKKLHELLTCGALTAEEFAALKRKVIAA